jgi:hypothetical protein
VRLQKMGLNLTFKTVKGNVFNLEFPPDSKVWQSSNICIKRYCASYVTCLLQVEEVKHKIEETQGPSLPAADLVVISQGKVGPAVPLSSFRILTLGKLTDF